MSGENIDQLVSSMTFTEVKALRTRLSKNIKNMRKRTSLSLTVYVQAEYRDSFETAKKWAFEHGLTKTDSNWAFAKFSITNTIQIILEQIERERNAPPEQPEMQTEQEEPIIP